MMGQQEPGAGLSPGGGETGHCGRLLDCAATGHTVCSRTEIAQDVPKSPQPRGVCRAEQREVWQCLHVREAGGAVGKHRIVWDVGTGSLEGLPGLRATLGQEWAERRHRQGPAQATAGGGAAGAGAGTDGMREAGRPWGDSVASGEIHPKGLVCPRQSHGDARWSRK